MVNRFLPPEGHARPRRCCRTGEPWRKRNNLRKRPTIITSMHGWGAGSELAEKTPIEPDLASTSEGSLAILAFDASSRSLPKVAIIGAGVCGLGIGWRLAAAGLSVTVFDRGQAGREASWAAAGMLAAGIEAEPGEDELTRLNASSQRLWPRFVRELEEASGIDIGYRDEGTLIIALTRDDVEQLVFISFFLRGL